jgi:hypothetical protein
MNMKISNLTGVIIFSSLLMFTGVASAAAGVCPLPINNFLQLTPDNSVVGGCENSAGEFKVTLSQSIDPTHTVTINRTVSMANGEVTDVVSVTPNTGSLIELSIISASLSLLGYPNILIANGEINPTTYTRTAGSDDVTRADIAACLLDTLNLCKQ